MMNEILCVLTRAMAMAALLLISSLLSAAAPKGLDQLTEGEWASVHAQIVAHRHRAEGDPVDGFRAHNGALGLAQRYHPDGRTQVEGQRLRVSLQLEAYGYGQLIQAGTPSLRAETDDQGAVVHYQWDDNLREWWLNRPGTLEQWFELQQRPADADGSPLQLQMALEVPENTPVHLDATGQALRIGEGEGALNYAGLKVWDTDGQILPARMQLNQAGDLLLSIDDALARYPVTIDPVWSQEVYFKASNADANDRFGFSIALSEALFGGETLVVGAPLEDSGLGGAPGSNSNEQSGAAYVFVRFGNQWLQQAYLKASNIGSFDQFGYSVAVSGDTLVVGAPREDSGATGVNGDQFADFAVNSGAAYVFVREGGFAGIWSQQAYLKASNTDSGDRFGHSVAVSGDRVVVGALNESSSATGVNGNQSNNNAEHSGAAYLFERNEANGRWSQLDYLKASNTGAGDQFGHVVAITGTTVVVGALLEDSNATGVNGSQANNSAADSGAVYVFQRAGINVGNWFQQAYLKASNADAGDLFGHSLALSGETLVVGAYREDSNATGVNGNQSDNSAANSGAAYVFVRTGGRNGSWSQQAYLKASNTEAGDEFGYSVGLSGNLLAVGAVGEDSNARGIDGNQANNSIGSSGAVYAFVRNETAWRPQAYIKASNTDFGTLLFGHSVAVSSSRVVVGSPQEGSPGRGIDTSQGPSNGAPGSGAAYGFLLVPTLGGNVAGLASGGSLTLRNSDGETRVIAANGPFSFGTVAFDSPYDVRVIAQPTGQVCTVANGSGTALGEVNDIQVNCAVGTFTISGTLAGLNAGLSVSLRNNEDVLTLSANGLFAFPTLLGPGNTFNVIVTAQPTGQTCLVAAGTGTVTANFPNIPFVQVVCIANTYSIGGTLFGLDPGQSVTLRNGADNLVLSANGSFVFPTRVTHGDSYAVTVTAQPVGRTCEVTGGAGVALGDVSGVQVVCIPNRYTIGGTVSGLDAGRSVTLSLVNVSLVGSPQVVTSNGNFTFTERTAPEGTSYTVSVSTQPVGQSCTVSNGSGVAMANVTDIEVTCVTNSYTIGGTLFGLAAGGSLTLQNNGGDDLLLGADGAFVFATQLLHGEPYAVTVSSAPADQTCFVSNGSGTAIRTVSNIQINCVTGTPTTIGGTVSGLAAGLAVTLQNNGRDDLRLTANGAFVFTAPISEGAEYLVTVRTQPSVQTCTVSNAAGVATANVTHVAVNCTANSFPIGGSLSDLGANRTITLQNNGGDDLVLAEDGFFVFPTQLTFGLPYSVSVSAQPVGQTCEVSNGTGTVVAGGNLLAAVTCSTDSYLIGGTLSGLGAGNSITLQNNGGDDLTLSADGSFFFPVPISPGGPYLVTVAVQPMGQTCTVSNGAGNATTFNDVNNVAVNCITSTFSIGGTLSGLAAGGSITLQNNGGDDLVLGSDGAFAFATRIAHGEPYAVTVASQPGGQTCSVTAATGTATGNVGNVQVQCRNNPGITVEPGSGLVTTEAGGTASFSVVLTSAPAAEVVIGLSSSDHSEGTVAPDLLSFSAANWNVPQEVMVTGVDDFVVDGDIAYSIVTAPAISADPDYNGRDASDVALINLDDDVRGITVSVASGNLAVTEGGATDSFTVVLNSEPTEPVSITLSGEQVTNAPSLLLFTPANWNLTQTVTVTAVDDALHEANPHPGSVSFDVSSGDGGYDGFGVPTLDVSVADNDPAPTVSISSPSAPEGDVGTSTLDFVVSLSAVSALPVSFDRYTEDGSATVGDNDYVGLAPETLTIEAGQQTLVIPVTIIGDSVFEGDQSFNLVLSAIHGAVPTTISGVGIILDDDQQPTTTTILSQVPATSVVGQAYVVSVSVSGVEDSPLGTLTISDGSESCGPVALQPGTAPLSTASCALASLSFGSKTLTAQYTPASTAFAPSTGNANHVVDPAPTSIAVSGPARSRVNQPTRFNVALSVNAPGGGTPSGTVTLSHGASSCVLVLPMASPGCELSFATPGTQMAVTASFVSSDGNHLPSSSSGAGNASTLVYALANVSVTKTESEGVYQPGDLIVYTIQVRNHGPDAAAQVRIEDRVPAGLGSVHWTCDASGGASCNPSSGSGNLDAMLAHVPVGALWNYSYFGTVVGEPAQIVNTATLTLPADTTVEDPELANNSATVTSLLETLFADGFEAPQVNAPAGSLRLPTAALAALLDEVARSIFRLDDRRGEVARVYARLHLGAVEYALAKRATDGSWTLGPWTAFAVEPTLSWSAQPVADAWQLTHIELR
jgi:uncharacterized repeat protein (TIGR01451 family)